MTIEHKNYPSRANHGHKYEPLSSSELEAADHRRHHSIEDPAALDLDRDLKPFKKKNRKRAVAFLVMGIIGVFLFLHWAIA
jgi:hypothetical protein